MSEAELTRLLRENMDATPVRSGDIPEIPLYIDQVLSLLDSRFQAGGAAKGKHIITKMMVHNYTKARLLKKPIGKKYTREHSMVLALICCLKQGLSIEEIGRLLQSAEGRLAEREGYSPAGVAELFIRFEELKRRQEQLAGWIAKNVLTCSGEEDLFAEVLYLVNLAGALNRTAEQLIDTLPDYGKKPEKTASSRQEK